MQLNGMRAKHEMPAQAVDEDGVNRTTQQECCLETNQLKSKGCERVRSVRVTIGSMRVCSGTEEAYTRCWSTKPPCHLYFDMDRHDSVFDYKVIKQHLRCLQSFLQTDTDLETATQFSNASRVNKTSLHVKVHHCTDVVHVQKITNAFNEWLLQDMNAFVYPSLINTDKTTTILDTNVHSNFQTSGCCT
jgi:hypothetical protein